MNIHVGQVMLSGLSARVEQSVFGTYSLDANLNAHLSFSSRDYKLYKRVQVMTSAVAVSITLIDFNYSRLL